MPVMTYDPLVHHRRSVRLREYSYAAEGMYFVTVCTSRRAPWLSRVDEGTICLLHPNVIADDVLLHLPARFPHIWIDTHVVMPDHIHVIVAFGDIDDMSPAVGARFIAPAPESAAVGPHAGAMNRAPTAGPRVAPTLGEVVRTFKATSTRLVRLSGVPDFAWQRNYYEHVVRDGRELDAIREYIAGNPVRWGLADEGDWYAV
jgi:REP element-mobilizing transposase RayT